MKQALRAMSSETGSLSQKVAQFLMAYRRTTHATTGLTPAHLFIGRPLRSRLDLITPNLAARMKHLQEYPEPKFSPGDQVAFRTYRPPDKWQFGTVTKLIGAYNYEIASGDLLYKRHIDQIRLTGTAMQPKLTTDLGPTNCDRELYPIPDTPSKTMDNRLQNNEQVISDTNGQSQSNSPDLIGSQGHHKTNAYQEPGTQTNPLRRSTRVKKPVNRLNL